MKSLLQEIFERLAAKIGADVIYADEFGYAGYIEFKNGRRAFFRGTSFDINPQGASRIAADKDYTAKILQRLGYPVPQGILVFSPKYREGFQRRNQKLYEQLTGLESAITFAEANGFPLFIKPNEESEGLGVSRIYDVRQLVDDVQTLFSWTDQVLVQKPLIGDDFRLVVLDGEVISAYRRRPLEIVGNGQHSIRILIDSKIAELRIAGRGKKIDPADPRIQREIIRQGRTFDDVPAAKNIIVLLPNANLSTGGEAEDFTGKVHASFRSYCAAIARDMGLGICGIDLITTDITQPLAVAPVLEINSAPGLNNFSATGEQARQTVERLYERILVRLRDGPPPNQI